MCESHLRWENLLSNLGTLGLQVLELFVTYEMDGETDGQTDRRTKAMLTAPSYGWGHNNHADVQAQLSR